MANSIKNKIQRIKKEQFLKGGSRMGGIPPTTSVSNLNFGESFKINDRELISPKLDYFSKQDIKRNIRHYIKSRITEMQLDEEETLKKFNTLPPYLLYDLYNLHKTEQSHMKIGKVDSTNMWQMNFINKFNNPYLRVVTQNHNFYSYLASAEMALRLVQVLKDTSEEGLKNQFGGGDSGDSDTENKLNNAIKEGQKKIDEKIQQAEEMSGLLPGDTSGNHDVTKQLDYLNLIKEIYVKENKITNFITKTLKSSTAYFSKKYKEYEENLIDSDEYDEILNLEELATPQEYNPLAALDLVTPRRQYHMKFDVYVDYSGSMNSDYRFKSKSGVVIISAYDLSVLTALKINKSGFINDSYLFDNQVKKVKDCYAYLKNSPGGGTTTDRVILNIEKTGKPGLIITDAQDHITEYSPNAFIILVLDGKISRTEAGDKFVSNRQVMKFDPNTNVFDFYKH